MTKRGKYIGIVVFNAVLCIVLHLVIPLTIEIPSSTLSALALFLGVPLTGLLWAGLAYSCVAFVFYLIEDRIPGEQGTRGLRYGISIGTLWLLGYMMCVPAAGEPVIIGFVGALCDATPVVVMGWLLGRYTSQQGIRDTSHTFNKKQLGIGIIVFLVVFFITRTGANYMKIIDIGFWTNPVYALVWTMVMGICLGITYALLGKTILSSSVLVSAMKFGFVLFGLTWGIFIMFFPMMLSGKLLNTILMFLIDALSVTAAYYFSEILLKRSRGVVLK